VALMGELARLVDVCALMDVSVLEQELACNDEHTSQWRELCGKLDSARVKGADKLRLGLLYALRYESQGRVPELKQRMQSAGVSSERVALVDALLAYAGASKRGPGLYGERGLLASMKKGMKTALEGIENVYSQHVPVLMNVLDQAAKGKLKDAAFPSVGGTSGGGGEKPPDIIVFMVGGVTFEESTKVAEWNATNASGVRVLLGGNFVHNSTSFLEEVGEFFGPHASR